jgi:hypothetical protein
MRRVEAENLSLLRLGLHGIIPPRPFLLQYVTFLLPSYSLVFEIFVLMGRERNGNLNKRPTLDMPALLQNIPETCSNCASVNPALGMIRVGV